MASGISYLQEAPDRSAIRKLELARSECVIERPRVRVEALYCADHLECGKKSSATQKQAPLTRRESAT